MKEGVSSSAEYPNEKWVYKLWTDNEVEQVTPNLTPIPPIEQHFTYFDVWRALFVY